jgi:hypothetical protein
MIFHPPSLSLSALARNRLLLWFVGNCARCGLRHLLKPFVDHIKQVYNFAQSAEQYGGQQASTQHGEVFVHERQGHANEGATDSNGVNQNIHRRTGMAEQP